jgi:hypothetical protein
MPTSSSSFTPVFFSVSLLLKKALASVKLPEVMAYSLDLLMPSSKYFTKFHEPPLFLNKNGTLS